MRSDLDQSIRSLFILIEDPEFLKGSGVDYNRLSKGLTASEIGLLTGNYPKGGSPRYRWLIPIRDRISEYDYIDELIVESVQQSKYSLQIICITDE